MKTPVDFLKYQLEKLEYEKKHLETEIADYEKRRDEALEAFKEKGLLVIDLKAAIKKLQES